jgi:hypothetical protein
MPRLIDDIRRIHGLFPPRFVPAAKKAQWDAYVTKLAAFLEERQLPVVLGDNVAQYYYEASDQEHWDLRYDFPNLAPPWPVFWIEHRLPRKIHSTEGDTDLGIYGCNGRTGALFFGAKVEDVIGEGIPEGTKWVLTAELFIEYGLERDRIEGPHGTCFFAIDGMGRLLETPYMQSWAPAQYNDLIRNLVAWLHPALLTICFLHCKNVRVEENPVPIKLAKRYAERHRGLKPTGFKTLVIEPLKQILRTQGRSGTVGVQKALHICRGQFWDYREGRGLFGKYHQLVWHDSTVRGVQKTPGAKPPPREVKVKL